MLGCLWQSILPVNSWKWSKGLSIRGKLQSRAVWNKLCRSTQCETKSMSVTRSTLIDHDTRHAYKFLTLHLIRQGMPQGWKSPRPNHLSLRSHLSFGKAMQSTWYTLNAQSVFAMRMIQVWYIRTCKHKKYCQHNKYALQLQVSDIGLKSSLNTKSKLKLGAPLVSIVMHFFALSTIFCYSATAMMPPLLYSSSASYHPPSTTETIACVDVDAPSARQGSILLETVQGRSSKLRINSNTLKLCKKDDIEDCSQ